MQITLTTTNPHLIKLSFAYENSQSDKGDIINNLMLSFAKDITKNLSSDPYSIEVHPNVDLSNFSDIGFVFMKRIFLEFKYTDNLGALHTKTRIINAFFDGYEEFVERRLNNVSTISVAKETFDLIDKLVTER